MQVHHLLPGVAPAIRHDPVSFHQSELRGDLGHDGEQVAQDGAVGRRHARDVDPEPRL